MVNRSWYVSNTYCYSNRPHPALSRTSDFSSAPPQAARQLSTHVSRKRAAPWWLTNVRYREVEAFVPRVVGGHRAAGNATLGVSAFEINEKFTLIGLHWLQPGPGGLQVVGRVRHQSVRFTVH
jgi:hypothetical protein